MATTVRTISAITSPQYGEAVGLYRETSAPSRAFCGMNSFFLSVFDFSPITASAGAPTRRKIGNPRVQGDDNYYALWDDLGRMVRDVESAVQPIATVLLEGRVCQCEL